MKQDDTHNEPLQDLLRRYLLEKQKKEGALSDLGKMEEKVFSDDPAVVMDEGAKKRMLAKLLDDFPPPPGASPPPAGAGGTLWLKLGIPAAAMLLAGLILIAWPKAETVNNADIREQREDAGTHPEKQAISDVIADKDKDTTTEKIANPADIVKPDSQVSSAFAVLNTPLNTAPNAVSLPSIPKLLETTQDLAEVIRFRAEENKVIVGKRGTLFYFPAGCFTLPDGSPASGEIELRIRESYSASQMVLNHMPAQDKEGALENAGMFSIEAKSGKSTLRLSKGMHYYAEFAGVDEQVKFPLSAQNSETAFELTPANRSRQVMVALPIGSIHFRQFLSPERGHKEWDDLIRQLNDIRFDGTWIATREFVERLEAARKLGYAAEILALYMDNARIELYKVDQLAAYHLRGNYQVYQQRGGADFGKEDFELFALQGLGFPMSARDFGVDLRSPDSRNKLAMMGASDEEIEVALQAFFLKDILLKEINEPIMAAKGKNLPLGSLENVKDGNESVRVWGKSGPGWAPLKRARGFQLQQLGMVCLGGAENLAEENQQLKVSVPAWFGEDNMKVYLSLNGRKPVVIEAAATSPSGEFEFRGIPKGGKGRVYALGYINGDVMFAEAPYPPATQTALNLEPAPASRAEILSRLEGNK